MLSVRINELKEKLKSNFQPLSNLKTYSSHFSVNEKISFINTLPEGVRGTCSRILDFFEGRVNTEITDDRYMIVYASQEEIAKTLKLSRSYVSTCISIMFACGKDAEGNEIRRINCPFVKVRQGLNKANYYVMEKKKELVEILGELFKLQEEARKTNSSDKQQSQKKEYKKKDKSYSRFNDYQQREYDFDKLEKGLLGWDNSEPD